MIKDEIQKREKKLLELTGTFCDQYLDNEYAQLSEKLIKKLGRKRDVPFQRGELEIWAASVIHALGSINFLFDKSFEPYISLDQLNDYFGTKKSTVSNKSKQIKDLLDLWHFSSEFSTLHMAESNPFNDMVMVDGFIVPLSELPEDLQELVREERAAGRDIEFTTNRDD